MIIRLSHAIGFYANRDSIFFLIYFEFPEAYKRLELIEFADYTSTFSTHNSRATLTQETKNSDNLNI
ncbi:unnamed protein product [Rotaria magnacalcarata]